MRDIIKPKRGRPAKKPEATNGPYRIADRDGKFILYHGNNVRQVFPTRDKALEYLEWVTK